MVCVLGGCDGVSGRRVVMVYMMVCVVEGCMIEGLCVCVGRVVMVCMIRGL